jgi:hypothetical protein
MPITDIILQALNPSIGEITQSLGLLNRVPASIRTALFDSLDEQMLRKLVDWSQTFVTEINKLPQVDHVSVRRLIDPNVSDDFLQTMSDASMDVPILEPGTLDEINNTMTKAIKANNWIQALQVGMWLAGAVSPAK